MKNIIKCIKIIYTTPQLFVLAQIVIEFLNYLLFYYFIYFYASLYLYYLFYKNFHNNNCYF